MGTILSSITPGAMSKVEVVYRGAIADMNVTPITAYLLVGLVQPHIEQPVNVINAPVIAKQRGLEVEQITSAKVREFSNLMEVAIHTNGGKRSAVGTIFGNRFPRVIAIDGYRMELKPEGHVVIIVNQDRPGVVGRYGTIFGNSNINIADMTFSRKRRSGMALVGITLDQPPTQAIMDEIDGLDLVESAYYIKLPELPADEQED
jgi:D-3-phosphoglycerate dehydrogenase